MGILNVPYRLRLQRLNVQSLENMCLNVNLSSVYKLFNILSNLKIVKF